MLHIFHLHCFCVRSVCRLTDSKCPLGQLCLFVIKSVNYHLWSRIAKLHCSRSKWNSLISHTNLVLRSNNNYSLELTRIGTYRKKCHVKTKQSENRNVKCQYAFLDLCIPSLAIYFAWQFIQGKCCWMNLEFLTGNLTPNRSNAKTFQDAIIKLTIKENSITDLSNDLFHIADAPTALHTRANNNNK